MPSTRPPRRDVGVQIDVPALSAEEFEVGDRGLAAGKHDHERASSGSGWPGGTKISSTSGSCAADRNRRSSRCAASEARRFARAARGGGSVAYGDDRAAPHLPPASGALPPATARCPRPGQPVRRSMVRKPSSNRPRIAAKLVDDEAANRARDPRASSTACAPTSEAMTWPRSMSPIEHHRHDSPRARSPCWRCRPRADWFPPGCPRLRRSTRSRFVLQPLVDSRAASEQRTFVAADERRCLHDADASPANDELRAGIGLRLEQHRVHVHGGRRAAREGLQRLRAADLAAIGGDRGVVRHVLRLERPHAQAAIREQPAQAGDQHGLAHVRAAALHHQRRPCASPPHDASQPAASARAPVDAAARERRLATVRARAGAEAGARDEARLRTYVGRRVDARERQPLPLPASRVRRGVVRGIAPHDAHSHRAPASADEQPRDAARG